MGWVRDVFASSLNQAEQALLGLVIGWSFTTAVGYGFARLSGGLNLQTIVLVTLFVWSGAILGWLPTIKRVVRDRGTGRRIIWEKSFTPLAILLCVFAPMC